MKKRFYIETFGCQMNKSDSEAMELSLLKHGFEKCENPVEAEILVFNTCSVRDHAEKRALSHIKSLKHDPRRKRNLTIVAGCMAQRIGDDLLHRGTADLVIGPYQSPDIGRILEDYLAKDCKNRHLSQEPGDLKRRIGKELLAIKGDFPWHKWVTITHGCENFCTYCIVPSVRGKLISFESDQIIDYIKDLAASEITEITLLGQNVNQFGTDSGDMSFAKLLEKAAGVPGLQRINFLTSHPKDFTRNIVEVIRDNPVISRAIHLPMQSGSDRILKLMNRQYTMAHYMGLVEMINTELKDYSLSTDIIVGFPGEETKDYKETLAAVEKIRFDNAFMYAYSPRKGTPACDLEDTVSREEKIKRLQRLIDIQRETGREKLLQRINNIEEVIVQRISKKSPEKVMGMTFLDHPVIIPGTIADIGKKYSVKIHDLSGATLQGTKIDYASD